MFGPPVVAPGRQRSTGHEFVIAVVIKGAQDQVAAMPSRVHRPPWACGRRRSTGAAAGVWVPRPGWGRPGRTCASRREAHTPWPRARTRSGSWQPAQRQVAQPGVIGVADPRRGVGVLCGMPAPPESVGINTRRRGRRDSWASARRATWPPCSSCPWTAPQPRPSRRLCATASPLHVAARLSCSGRQGRLKNQTSWPCALTSPPSPKSINGVP
jgi:hypothetical protein